MARRAHSSITDRVPEDIRKQLDDELLSGMRIREAVGWLEARGFETSKSAVGRYYLRNVRPLEEAFRRAEAFSAILSEGGERPATELQEAANMLLTNQYLQLLMQLGQGEEETETGQLLELAMGLSKLQTSAVANEKLKTAQRKSLSAALDRVMSDLTDTLAESHPQLLEQLEAVVTSRRAELQ